MIEVIKKALTEAKKHRIHNYAIACSIEDYPEVKAICKSNFPDIRVKHTRAVEKGRIYLWDKTNILYDFLYYLYEESEEGSVKSEKEDSIL